MATDSQRAAAAYIGRFAPSPTGPLHFGSLLAAVASYLQARSRHGQWLLRVEDIDPPREQAGATDEILKALDCYGFQWDGAVSYQSTTREAHDAAIRQLVDTGHAYRCGCSRKDLADIPRGPLGTIYPGNCREGSDAEECAIRVRTNDQSTRFHDGLQGEQSMKLESESGDFVILRRDDLVAYQLAVVVDDHLQGITEIVRGIDLLNSTPRQIWLQQLLGYATPGYLHIPVVVNSQGQKLSKLTGAPAIPCDAPGAVLVEALAALRQAPPSDLADHSLSDIWGWAIKHWQIGALAGLSTIRPANTTMDGRENGLR
ncbi:MAG: tRNA glutamyl-Q(34) synthetase GluQRS [Woeseiaceae bacterium]|nr:tRNA glutamyl-Q(34) synthetase GluQRS [Woeseiaceae bacterium]